MHKQLLRAQCVTTMLQPYYKVLRVNCCVTTTTIDQLVTRWLQGSNEVVTTLLPGGKHANSRVQTTLL